MEPLFRQATKQVPVEALTQAADKFGTPVYVTDLSLLRAHADEVHGAFPDPWIRQFSVKANDVPAIIREVAACRFGANVVSRGEWALATEARLGNDRITLEGVGKSDEDLQAAVQARAKGTPLQWIAIESAEEAGSLAELAAKAGLSVDTPVDVLLRLNPGVVPETSSDLAVGRASSKFGMTVAEIDDAIHAAAASNGALRWRGLHLHVGSQLQAVHAWQAAVRRALQLFVEWRHRLPLFDTLDIGGGFPVGVSDVPRPADFAASFAEAIGDIEEEDRPRRLAIEPGRFLTASAGYLVARVLHARQNRGADGQPMVVIDAGMTELIRPALYGAEHPIIALTRTDRTSGDSDLKETIVEGPICESTDRLGMHRLQALRRGDLVAILETGAYASSMSSRYNGRPRAAEVLLGDDGRLILGRPRSHAGLWQRL